MTKSQIKKEILSYDWERWLERPFGGFILSLFIGGNSRRAMHEIGLDIEHTAALYEGDCFQESEQVYEETIPDIEKEEAGGFSIKQLSRSCEKYRTTAKSNIKKIASDATLSPRKKLALATDIIKIIPAYIWFAHDYEYYLTPKLKEEIPKYFSGNIDKLIGDLSFPTKLSSHNYLEQELLAGENLDLLVNKYGWIKVRDSFSDSFTTQELQELKDSLLQEKPKPVKHYDIPKQIKKLIEESRELVYYRTLRTDVFYELLFRARPIFQEVAEEYGLAFKDLSDYSVYDLIKGKLIRYPESVTCAYYKDEAAFFNKPILPRKHRTDDTIKGTVAYSGKVKGRVKVVKNVDQLNKVKQGDILVTFMTAPSHISAMKKAKAFVTDEGGITCHAAIVAREMKKPCIIGTKIATRVLKDGDMVEVDADEGVVKKIK